MKRSRGMSMEVDEPSITNTFLFGCNLSGQIGDGLQSTGVWDPTPLRGGFRVASLSFGDSHTASLTEDGDVYTWGEGPRGQLGQGDSSLDSLSARRVTTLDGMSIKHVSCGSEFTCCVAQSGDVLVFGNNDRAQLGLGPAQLQLAKPRPIPFFRGWSCPVIQVACGSDFSLALSNIGAVYGWGNNVHGTIGQGSKGGEVQQPTLLEGLWARPVTLVSAGGAHALALTASGHVYSWGRNKAGQLGLSAEGQTAQASAAAGSARPAAPAASKAPVNLRWAMSLVDMGFSLAQAEEALAATGSVSLDEALERLLNGGGSSGAGKGPPAGSGPAAASDRGAGGGAATRTVGEEGTSVPTRIRYLSSIVHVAAGGDHSAAVDSEGRLFTWGRGRGGQLGHGSLDDQWTPKEVVRAGQAGLIRRVSCGAVHTVALSDRGVVLGAGSNEFGQLSRLPGDASSSSELVPLSLALPDGSEVQEVVSGGHCTAVLTRPAGAAQPQLQAQAQPGSAAAPLSAEARLRDLIARAAAIDLERDSSYEARSARDKLVKDVAAVVDQIFRSPSAVASIVLPRRAPTQPGQPSPGAAELESDPVPDTARLTDLFKIILGLFDTTAVQALHKALLALAENLRDRAHRIRDAERSLALLPLLQCPLLSDPRYALSLIPALGEVVVRLGPEGRAAAVRQISRYPKEILGAYVVRPLLGLIRGEVDAGRISRTVFLAVHTLELLHEGSSIEGLLRPDEFYSDALSTLLCQDEGLGVASYTTWRRKYAPGSLDQVRAAIAAAAPGEDPLFTLCEFPFLLTPKAKARLLRVEAELNMAQVINASRREQLQRVFGGDLGALFGMGQGGGAGGVRDPLELDRVAPRGRKTPPVARATSGRAPGQSQASSSGPRPSGGGRGGQVLDNLVQFVLGLGGGSVGQTWANEYPQQGDELPAPEACGVPPSHQDFCVLRVRRAHLLEDALEEIARQRPRDLHKPLRCHFIGEEGVDAGGVRKEFFQLLLAALLDPMYSMFLHNPETRTVWLNPDSLESDVEFQLAGIAVGLAAYNGVLLDLPLPIAMYKKLVGLPVGLGDLPDMQPTLGRSLTQLLAYEGEGSVEDVFCLTFSVDVSVFGEVRSVPLKPGGEGIAVTEANRAEYVELYTDYVLNTSIRRQFEAFQKGFLTLCGGPVLRLLLPSELEELVCGEAHLDFAALRRGVRYEGGYTNSSQVVQWLWQILDEYSSDERKRFLKFFSGSDRAPIGGLGSLTLTVQRAGPDSERLPSASTCFNILILPEYSSRGKTREKLRIAIEAGSEGFGLQ